MRASSSGCTTITARGSPSCTITSGAACAAAHALRVRSITHLAIKRLIGCSPVVYRLGPRACRQSTPVRGRVLPLGTAAALSATAGHPTACGPFTQWQAPSGNLPLAVAKSRLRNNCLNVHLYASAPSQSPGTRGTKARCPVLAFLPYRELRRPRCRRSYRNSCGRKHPTGETYAA